MSFLLQPVRVGTGSDEEGLLVFDADERLVAVLVRLSERHENLGLVGHWFLEAGFGPVDGCDYPTFADLDQAQEWIERRSAHPTFTP
jgi:hypothetical protein